ncbi:MAG: hypothetical protein GYB68_10445 [Chloroflexi bacterium]|nr:hypothetical protein [Chloroflexota bacterium]
MSITLDWYDEAHSILIWRYDKVWTWDELVAISRSQAALVADIPHLVSIVHDFHQTQSLPERFLARLPLILPPHLERPANISDITVIVGLSGALLRTAQIVSRVFMQVQFAETIEEAAELIINQVGRPTSSSQERDAA